MRYDFLSVKLDSISLSLSLGGGEVGFSRLLPILGEQWALWWEGVLVGDTFRSVCCFLSVSCLFFIILLMPVVYVLVFLLDDSLTTLAALPWNLIPFVYSVQECRSSASEPTGSLPLRWCPTSPPLFIIWRPWLHYLVTLLALYGQNERGIPPVSSWTSVATWL